MSGESSFLITVRRTQGANNTITLGNIERFVRLEYVLVENDVGALSLTLPDTFPQEWFATDTILEVYRTIDGVTTLEGETVWFVRETRFTLTERGEWFFVVIAFDAKHLLNRRIINSYAGSAIASKTGATDNIMRQIVREHLGSSASADAIGPRYIISVEPDTSSYTSESKAFAWRKVFAVLGDMAASVIGQEYCAFHVAKNEGSQNDLIFRVRRGGWGVDHGSNSGQAVVFTPENGALFNVMVTFDAREEATVARVGGQGEGQNRAGTTVAFSGPMNRSYWNRIEAHVDARNTVQFGELTGEGFAYLSAHLARWRFSAQIQQTAQLKYGINYRWGDTVVANARGLTFDVHLSKVHVKATTAGEDINIQVSAESTLQE